MNINEMHVTFLELAQQMGMQTVRAILNEDIDICLNGAIIDKVREVVLSSVSPVPYPDKVIRQNANIAPVNALRTLYRSAIITEDDITIKDGGEVANEVTPWSITINSNSVGLKGDKVMLYTGFKVSYDKSYLYDCRIIENEDLGQTLRDFCNRASYDAPIASVFGDKDEINVSLYTGRTVNTWEPVASFMKPKIVQFLYIKEPAKVRKSLNEEENVDCDLPPYLHSEIVERGVQKYLVSIGATSGQVRQRGNNEQ